MFPVKIAITGLMVVAIMTGCAKKKVSKDNEFATSTNSAVTKPSASQDIFDEFYKADTAVKPHGTKAAVPEPVERAPLSSEFTKNGRFVLQVSTVRFRPLADKISAKLSAKGYPAYIAEVENPTPSLPGTYYRIRVGGFATLSAARTFGETTLTKEGYTFWVDNRSNDNVGLQGGVMGSGDTYYSTDAASTTPATINNQSSYTPQPTASSAIPDPAPVIPPTEPLPASSYTQENTAKEFEATPTPPPAPAPPAPAQPSTTNPTKSDSEWGNEGW